MKMNGLHAVVVPYPAQGTINPLLNFAHLLSSRGVFITFVNTEWSHNRMPKGAVKDNDDETFKFLTIPDGLPPDHLPQSNPAESIIAIENLGPVLEHHLRRGLAEGAPPISCIITESFMSCTYQVANNMGLPRVIFWPMCAASSIAQCYSNLLLSRGHIPVKAEHLKREAKVITCLPGNLPPLLPSDLCSFYRGTDTSDFYFQWFVRESQFQSKADYVLINTFDELEPPETVSALSCNGCPALAVGPVFLPNFQEGKDLSKQASLLEQDESCLKWLDAQKPNSVIYVSFGSTAVASNEQLEELALGLEKSEHPFLWVLRMDIARGMPATLPEGFEERTKDRCLIVKWAPQVKVLAHPSVGGFLTHSGWNSCLESMSMGIPMLGWPHFSDQFLDCRFCKDVWKIGMAFEGVDVDENLVVRREEIEKGVRGLMEGPKAEELRKRGMTFEGVDVDENLVVRREEIEKGVRGLMEGSKAEELRKRGMTFEDVDVDENLVVRREEIEKGVRGLMEGSKAEELRKRGMTFEGVDVDENLVVRREEIEKGVRGLMEGPKAEELRKRGMELKEAAYKAVGEGGSSFLNLNKFIHDMMQLSKSTSIKIVEP